VTALASLNIGDSIERGFNVFFAWIPALIGAIVILIVGYIVAKVVGNLLARVLGRAGLDRTLGSGRTGEWVYKLTSSPSRLLGRFAFWAIFLGAVSLAATALGITALTAFIGAIYAYLPNVVAALAIFLVAGALAAGIATLATRFMGDTATGRVVATVAPILVMTIATFMILEQLRIAHDIVVTTYTLVLGAVALASALAFGLGGRDVAARILEGAYVKGQASKEQVKRDVEQGKIRAQIAAEEKRQEMEYASSSQDVGARTRST
jgi:Conserved TM helix